MAKNTKPDQPSGVASQAAPPAELPPAAAAQVAAATTDDLTTLLRLQAQALAIQSADLARAREIDQQQQRQVERARAESSKSAQQRTQELADRTSTGPERFRVAIPKDPCQPVLDINAHSEDEARARYQRLCGIRSSEHPILCVPAPAEPPLDAPERIKLAARQRGRKGEQPDGDRLPYGLEVSVA